MQGSTLPKARGSVLIKLSSTYQTATSADFTLLALLTTALLPAFSIARLPFRIDLAAFASAYWAGTAAQAIFVATVLSLGGLPLQRTLLPMWNCYVEQKSRFFALALLVIWMAWLFGPWLGLIVLVDALAIAELLQRTKDEFKTVLLDVFIPSVYLFVGVLLIYLLNHAIAGIEFAGTYDQQFNRADIFLFGTTASAVSGWMVKHFSTMFFSLMEFVYRALYPLIGAAIALTAVLGGRKYAVCYVRTLLIAYCFALGLFVLWPTIGPFSFREPSVSGNLSFLSTYSMQEVIVLKARLLWEHRLQSPVTTVNLADYYIGFPSMHVAMPLIAIWFLRKWRRIMLVLVVADIMMLLSIVALDWHYFVDLLGGIAVAAAAILVHYSLQRSPFRTINCKRHPGDAVREAQMR